MLCACLPSHQTAIFFLFFFLLFNFSLEILALAPNGISFVMSKHNWKIGKPKICAHILNSLFGSTHCLLTAMVEKIFNGKTFAISSKKM